MGESGIVFGGMYEKSRSTRFVGSTCDDRCDNQRSSGEICSTMTRKQEIRDEVDYPSDTYTRLKHAFYRRYIACWMGKILQGHFGADATVVEGFSGSGKYSDGPDGSALNTTLPG